MNVTDATYITANRSRMAKYVTYAVYVDFGKKQLENG